MSNIDEGKLEVEDGRVSGSISEFAKTLQIGEQRLRAYISKPGNVSGMARFGEILVVDSHWFKRLKAFAAS